jgi:chromosome segregation ATPase
METINQLDTQLIQAQEELQLIPELKDRVAELSSILKEAESELTKQRHQTIQYEKALAETELNLMNVEAEATLLKNEVAELQRNNEEMHLESAIMNNDTEDGQRNTEAIDSEGRSIQSSNPTSDEIIVPLNDKPNENKDLSQLLDTYKSRISSLENELSTKERDQDELSEALVSAVEEKRQIQEQIDEQYSDITKYQQQIKDLMQDIESKELDIERLLQSKRDNSEDGASTSSPSMSMEIERLRVDLQISETNLEVAKESIAEREVEVHDLRKKCEDLQARYSKEVEDKESLIARSEASLESSQRAVSENLEEIQSLNIMLNDTNSKLSQQTSDHEAYIGVLKNTLDEAKNKIEQLQCENKDQNAIVQNFELMKNKVRELEATKATLEVQIDELQRKNNDMEDTQKREIETIKKFTDSNLNLEIQEKDTMINNLRRELKLLQAQAQVSQSSEPFVEQKMKHVHTSTQTDLDTPAIEADAKEAISELVSELQAVTLERESVKSKLADAENKILAIVDSCNQRDLEIIALESSLKKAHAIVGVRSSDESDEMRLVIGELVNEIARIRASAETFEIEKEEIAVDLQYSDETAELEAQRANNAESEVRNLEDFLKSILDNLMDSNLRHEARCHLCINRMRKWFLKCSDAGNDVFHSFDFKAGCFNELEDLDKMNDHTDIVPLGKLFSPNGTEYHDTIDEPSPMTKGKSPLVHYEEYQILRRKCDMLEAEREELINETFALLDSSSAANAAEISALESKLRREAMEQVDECTQRLTTYFVDRMERFATMRRWQIEGSSPTKSKSD